MTDEGTGKKPSRYSSTVATWVDQEGNVKSKTEEPAEEMEDKPILPVTASWNFTMTDEQVAEIKQTLDSLEPDDTTNDVPSSTMTADQWIAFTQMYATKRVYDPRRARPI